MDLRIIDRWRGATVVPTKALTADSDFGAEMRHLAAGQHVHTGQVEFEVDQECLDAVKALDGWTDEPPVKVPGGGERVGTFDGVPVVLRVLEPA